MNMKNLLKERSLKIGRNALKKAMKTYLESRSKTFSEIDIQKLKEKLKEIKEFSISNLDELVKKAVNNLKKQGIKVYLARDNKEACEIALKLIPKGEKVVKSKSNAIKEIGLIEKLEGRNRVIETDCGDFLVELCDEKLAHPVLPAVHIPISKIVEKIKKKYKEEVEEDPVKITHWVREKVRSEILTAKIGLTGANAISADGAIFILENEGNISLISKIPEKHIIITGIEKVVRTIEDAMTICHVLAIWGTGANMPSYVNVISGPSMTADVAEKLVVGMHGPCDVHLILVDNGRSEIAKSELKEILYCINCGACLYFCPVYRQILYKYGHVYLGGIGVAKTFFHTNLKVAFEKGLYFCTTCSACKEQCPLSIDIPEIIRKLREMCVKKGIETVANKEMIENIGAFENPFGETLKEDKMPEKLYCC